MRLPLFLRAPTTSRPSHVDAGSLTNLPRVLLQADLAPKQTENAQVELSLIPEQPVAGSRTSLLLKLTAAEGLETCLGAWGHMLTASADLIEMIHGHPGSNADVDRGAAKQLEFSTAFPRAGMYRAWVQLQRLGIVNTVACDVPFHDE